MANSTYAAEFISDSPHVQRNLLSASVHHEVPKVLFLGLELHLPEVRRAADPRGQPSDGGARAD